MYFNLAQSQFTNKEFNHAKSNYTAAIDYAKLASDCNKRIQAQLSLAKLFLKIGDTSKAKKIISTIDKKTLPDFLLPLFMQIKSQI